MALHPTDIKYIAHLARIAINADKVPDYARDLSRILEFVEQMNQVDTTAIEPMAHPLETSQRMRPDEVTETDQRELFQSLAPQIEAGVYLVPKVIE